MANQLPKETISLVMKELERDGREIIKACEAERTYTHQTHNLKDSYGYGVYYHGTLKRKGFLSDFDEASGPRKVGRGEELSGREEIISFLENYKAQKNGAELVVAVAMPYGAILEESPKYHGRYRVIAMSFDKMQELKEKYKGGTVRRISNGVIA